MHKKEEKIASGKRWAKAILKVLDQYADEGNFPMLGSVGYYLGGRIRLVAFRSASEWLVTLSAAEFDLQAGTFRLSTFGFGNELRRQGIQSGGPELFYPSPHDPWFSDNGDFRLNPLDFAIAIRGGKGVRPN
jgi:hypothetical protein